MYIHKHYKNATGFEIHLTSNVLILHVNTY